MSLVQLEFNMSSKFPYDISRVCPDTLAEIDKNFEEDGMKCEYEVKEIGLNLAERYVEMGPRIYSMEVRPDDIWLVTFPKCGTTWTQVNILSFLFVQELSQ